MCGFAEHRSLSYPGRRLCAVPLDEGQIDKGGALKVRRVGDGAVCSGFHARKPALRGYAEATAGEEGDERPLRFYGAIERA